MSSLKIRVGAALDANIGSVFVPLIKASEQARKQIRGNLGQALDPGPYRTSAKAAGDAIGSVGGAAQKASRITGNSVQEIRRQLKAFGFEVKQDLDLSSVARAAESELKRMERAAARARLGVGGGGGFGGGGAIGLGRRAGIRTSRGFAAAYGYSGAALSTAASALGINTDVAQITNANFQNADLAQKIINSAPEFNKAGVGERQKAAGGLLKGIESVGTSTATDFHEALEGLEAFVAKTGDLKTGQDVIGNLARLSRATGTNLADMSNAAAEVSNNLGDVPEKGKAIYEIMKAIAGQGKLGAVEVKDLASQMAKIASVSSAFEGDRGRNIGILGAMAQEAKLRGGAASATQATTSVQAFVSNLTKGPTLKNWAAMGISPYADAGHTKLRGPEEIILEALKATAGDLTKMNKLFGSAQATRAVRGFASVYNDAGGGKAGLEAVDAEFKRLAAGVMTEADVTNAFTAQMHTTKSQVQVFNNQLQAAAEQLEANIIPALSQFATELIPVVGAFAQWASGPLQTVLLGEQARMDNEANAGLGAQSGALNYISQLHRFESTNLELMPSSGRPAQAVLDAEMQQIAPLLSGADARKKALFDQASKWQATVDEERSSLRPNLIADPYSDKEIKDLAASGDDKAIKYIADKATLDRLNQTQTDLMAATAQLVRALESGTVRVHVASVPTPVSTDHSGRDPGLTPNPDEQ